MYTIYRCYPGPSNAVEMRNCPTEQEAERLVQQLIGQLQQYTVSPPNGWFEKHGYNGYMIKQGTRVCQEFMFAGFN